MVWIFANESLRLLSAALLCGLIGLERQYHQKNAGIRTHALVGMGACLFTLVGLHPWDLSLAPVSGDQMRIAAQVVSGIGFLGAGLIFVNRDAVRGLTTAAGVWLSAAIGMSCGAKMIPLAAITTALYLFIIFVISPLARHLPTSDRHMLVRINYLDHTGTLRRILSAATEMGFESAVISSAQITTPAMAEVEVVIRFSGGLPLRDLIAELSEVEGVTSVDMFEDSGLTDD